MNLQESSADLYLIFLAICNFKDHAVFALEYLLINLELENMNCVMRRTDFGYAKTKA